MRLGGSVQHRKFLLRAGVLLLLFSAAGAGLEARFLRTTALAMAEREGTLLAHHLGTTFFKPGIFLDNAGDLTIPNTLTETVKEDLRDLGIVMLKIYDIRGKIVAATDPTYVGMEKGDNPSFRAALDGKTVAKVANRAYYRDLYGRDSTEDLLELYVPLWTPGRNAPAAVVEIYRPWALYQPLIRAGMLRTAIVAVVLAGVCFLLILVFVRSLATPPHAQRNADGGTGDARFGP